MKKTDFDALLKEAYRAAMGEDYVPPQKPPLEQLVEWADRKAKILEENR